MNIRHLINNTLITIKNIYNDVERGMKKKARYGQYQMMSGQRCNIAQCTSSKSEQVKSSNAWYSSKRKGEASKAKKCE